MTAAGWNCAGLAALLFLLSGAAGAQAGTILVLSQTTPRLTALDSTTHAVRGSLDLDAGAANLAVSPDGRRAYVAHADKSKVAVIDLAGWRREPDFRVPGSPFGLAVSADGKLYVGNWNGDDVIELDATSGAMLRSARIGKAPAHLAITPDQKQLVAVAREANTVVIIDGATFAPRATLAVERAPFALAVSPDGTRAFVANAQAGSVSVVDLQKAVVTATTRVGAMPYGVAFTGDGRLALVTNQQSGTVSILGDGQPQAPGLKVGAYPEGIAVDVAGTTAYVANWSSDDLSVIDIAARKETARIKLPGGPRTIAIVAGDVGP